MKTFEEAMELRAVYGPEDLARKAEAIERYRSMLHEIADSEAARSFVMHMAMEFPDELSDEDRFLSVLVSVFVNGIMVGIEMEKSE